MLHGRATSDATRGLQDRFPDRHDLYREAQGLTLSSVGIGTYLGKADDATTHLYTDAVCAAVAEGINLIDTSLNYRNQRSELAIRAALVKLREQGRCERAELVICSKAGYLVPGAVPGMLRQDEIVGGMHSLAPSFLADQLERSRTNLGLGTIDVFYLHNPETQLGYIEPDTFYSRMRAAFEQLEHMVSQGKIAYYGTATWDGYRKRSEDKSAMSLPRLAEIAREAGGDQHHFRFIQLPFNLAMSEAATLANQPVDGGLTNVVEAASRFGISVIASASLLQARLSRNLPDEVASRFPGLTTHAQRALEFVRTTPGISSALAGMSKTEHVRENVAIAVAKARHA